MSRLLLAVDPGETAGAVLVDYDGHLIDRSQASPWQIVGWVHDKLDRAASGVELVVERFTITAATVRMTRQYAALEMIGALRYLTTSVYQLPFDQQSRNEKGRVDRATLLRLGWWWASNEHANDAARHAVIAVARRHPNGSVARAWRGEPVMLTEHADGRDGSGR